MEGSEVFPKVAADSFEIVSIKAISTDQAGAISEATATFNVSNEVSGS